MLSTTRGAILLATRDKNLEAGVREALGESNLEFRCVDSVERVLDLLAGQEFDLLIFDPELKPLENLDALGVIRSYRPRVPIVLISGERALEQEIQIAGRGVLLRMLKPVDFGDVRKLLDGFHPSAD
jgi:DNA-binding response OmpR family regulator